MLLQIQVKVHQQRIKPKISTIIEIMYKKQVPSMISEFMKSQSPQSSLRRYPNNALCITKAMNSKPHELQYVTADITLLLILNQSVLFH